LVEDVYGSRGQVHLDGRQRITLNKKIKKPQTEKKPWTGEKPNLIARKQSGTEPDQKGGQIRVTTKKSHGCPADRTGFWGRRKKKTMRCLTARPPWVVVNAGSKRKSAAERGDHCEGRTVVKSPVTNVRIQGGTKKTNDLPNYRVKRAKKLTREMGPVPRSYKELCGVEPARRHRTTPIRKNWSGWNEKIIPGK